MTFPRHKTTNDRAQKQLLREEMEGEMEEPKK